MPKNTSDARKAPQSQNQNPNANHPGKIDPLYTIFEQHLFNFQDPNSDRKTFVDQIVKDYLSQMRRMGLNVPAEWESHIHEELSFQVNTMLVKKIYGCLSINEFQEKKVTPVQKKRAAARYQRLQTAKKAA